jgi:hypothetical protein
LRLVLVLVDHVLEGLDGRRGLDGRATVHSDSWALGLCTRDASGGPLILLDFARFCTPQAVRRPRATPGPQVPGQPTTIGARTGSRTSGTLRAHPCSRAAVGWWRWSASSRVVLATSGK